MNFKTVFVLALGFVIGFVTGGIVTFKGIRDALQERREIDQVEQGGKIGV